MDYTLNSDSSDEPARRLRVYRGDLRWGHYQAVLEPTTIDRDRTAEVRAVPREHGYAFDIALIVDGGYGTLEDAKRVAAVWRERVVSLELVDPSIKEAEW